MSYREALIIRYMTCTKLDVWFLKWVKVFKKKKEIVRFCIVSWWWEWISLVIICRCVLLRPKEALVYNSTHTLGSSDLFFFLFFFFFFILCCARIRRRSRARALLPAAAADDRVPLAERPPPTWRKTRKQEPATRRRKGRDEYKLNGPRHLKFSWLHDAGWKLSTFSLSVCLSIFYKLLERP